jgi:hypothetical protein
MDNIIIFIGYPNQIPIALGLFGKENLEYKSKFDATDFEGSTSQMYYHSKLNSVVKFYMSIPGFLNESDDYINGFNKSLIFIETLNNHKAILHKLKNIHNYQKCFIWHYAEVFEKGFINIINTIGYDFILSGSKRPELENDNNFNLDLLLPFRYFRYYIGYYWLESLMDNLELPKYDKSKPKLFSYVRAHGNSSWRSELMESINGIGGALESKNSANDAYDLLYPKYKHFEAINDYVYCNFNLLFETLDYRNNDECFITEKTFKGLFFSNPIMLVTSPHILNYLKNKGFSLINFEFMDKIETSNDVQLSIQKFVDWLNVESDEIIEKRYNQFLDKSKNNRKILFDYLNDYSQSERMFQKLLNN